MRHWAQLLRTLVLRPLARDPLRSALTIISIALGVGVVIAIDLSGQAATGSFRNSLTSILGKTDYSIVANGGVDEKWMGTLAALPLNAHFTPVIESSIQLPELGFVTLYGVDTVAEAQQGIATSIPSGCAALVAAQDLARRWHHQLNDRIHLFDRDFCLIQIVDARNGGFIGMDIAEAQRILHGFGTVDHIDIRVDPQESAEAVQSAVRRVIPAAYQITESGTRSRENQRMLRAFRWNLQVLSYVSLVVGAFLIYNTVAVSVVRRRPEIGILRALGTGRQGIFWLFLSEALLLGLAGSLVGLLLGRFLAQGMVTLISQTINGRPLFGYAATLLSIVAAALLAPLLVVHVTHWLRPAAHRWFGVGAFLGARGLTASLGRTSVVVAALATSIAMMASMGVLVGSFRETVLVWLGQQLRADLYLRGSGPTAVGAFPPLPANVEPTLRKLPQIEAIDVFAGFDFRYGEDRATLGATDTEVARRFGRTRLLPGENYDRVMRSLPNQNNVVISEPFANKHNLRAGDPIQLNIGSTVAQFHVAGIYYEYSSERGYVLMDRTILNRYMPGAPLTNIGIYLKPGQNADIAQQQIEAALATFPVAIARNRELRAGAVEIFDRTFAVTYAMELIAILVAMLGAANSLLALVLDRRREIGTLRYLGASTQQIRAMVLTEAAFIGGLATILGVALGAALSLLLIYVMNKQSFGWTIQLHPPYLLLVGALLLIWVVTVLAGLYPARVAGRLNPIQVIHEE
jgi:ABC-type antimicrobial peptide transport system permease subunit